MGHGMSSLAYVGIKNHVVALDRATGVERWRTRLPVKFATGSFLAMAEDGASLVVASAGEVFCLDGASGSIRWSNPLKGLGYGFSTVLLPGGKSSAIPLESVHYGSG